MTKMFYFSHWSLFLFRILDLRFICYLVFARPPQKLCFGGWIIWNLIFFQKNKDFICNTINHFYNPNLSFKERLSQKNKFRNILINIKTMEYNYGYIGSS